jgi:DNA-binding HxlR family transcriptional regulator
MAPKDIKAATVPAKRKKPRRPRAFEEKWGADVRQLGFTMVPSLLFKAQQRLGLSPTQLVVLLQLIDHWWDLERHPWPSKELLSTKIGINPRQVQRVVAELEKGGFLKRTDRYLPKGGKTSNEYVLTGLVTKLKKLAPEFKKIEDEVKSRRRAVVRKGYRKSSVEGTPA